MTTNFLDTFSGSSVSPSQVAFANYSFATDLTLFWPDFSAGQTNIAARFMNMTATVNTSLNVIMPDATLVSVGYDVIIFNQGTYIFNVVDSQGGAIATINAGETYYILLNDNTIQAGGWQTVQFGVGTGSADAAALAGEGLIAAAGLLETNIATDVQSIDYTITALSRARLQVWEGGAGVITLPTAASVGNGFFFPIANNGTGSVTITPDGSEEIDGTSTSVFTQSQSAYIVSSGTAWYTIGKGLQNNFSVTLLNLNVAGSSDVTETSSQAQNVIQQFTGALTGNINVIVPNTVQLYYIFNNTTGTHTLTVKTAAGTGIVIPQATHVILYCDGTNVVSAFTSNTSVLGSPVYTIGVAGGTANALTGNATNFVLQLGTVVFLTPSLLNTAAATLNVQATGAIAIKKVAPSGLIDLTANDLIPGLVNVLYYNGTYWISINTIYEGLYQTLSGNATMDFTYFLNSVNVTTAVNLTLPVTTAFPSYFYTTLFAKGGALTLIPNAADSIQGTTAGTNYVLPQGASAKLATDGAGNWTLFLLTGVSGAIVDDTTTNASVYPTWVTASSGNLPLKVSSTKLSFNPSTGILTALGGLVGNASTATALQNARTIGGISFNGTANITVASATGGFTISGGDLALGANNITMTGSLGATGARLTKGWFTDLQVTNAIAGSITGNAATVTTNANLTGPITSTGNATAVTNNAITNAMLAQASAFTIKSNNTGSGANVTDSQLVTVIDAGAGTFQGVTPAQGDIIYRNASQYILLHAGTSGQFLQTQGGAANPQWANAGAYILLSTQTAANSAALNFTSVITSSYDYYIFVMQDLRNATNNQDLQYQVSTDNGATYDTSANYIWGSVGGISTTSGTQFTFTGSSGTSFNLTLSKMQDNAAASALSGKVELFSPNTAVKRKFLKANVEFSDGGGSALPTAVDIIGFYNLTTAINAVRFKYASGNITSGKIYCYGAKNS